MKTYLQNISSCKYTPAVFGSQSPAIGSAVALDLPSAFCFFA